MGLEHFNYLLGVLKKFHGTQYNMAGNKFAGMDIKWDYAACRCRISARLYNYAVSQIQASTPCQTRAISI
jgi:hypothetical protein